jgi:hypothetical protein
MELNEIFSETTGNKFRKDTLMRVLITVNNKSEDFINAKSF